MPTAIDHGLHLVHNMDGTPRNYLHEVSFKDDDRATRECLTKREYEYQYGFNRHGTQYWCWVKRFPLDVYHQTDTN
jgi:hypothetical protein